MKSVNEEDWRLAVDAFVEAHAVAAGDTERARALWKYAELLNNEGDPQNADPLIREARRLGPDNQEIAELASRIQAQIENPTEAQQLELLASLDDQAAAVSLYLAADSEILERDSTGLLPRLRASMESGYALATFWYAIRLREELRAEPVAPGTSRHVNYCETMRRAYEQGLREIARQYLDSEFECGMLQ